MQKFQGLKQGMVPCQIIRCRTNCETCTCRCDWCSDSDFKLNATVYMHTVWQQLTREIKWVMIHYQSPNDYTPLWKYLRHPGSLILTAYNFTNWLLPFCIGEIGAYTLLARWTIEDLVHLFNLFEDCSGKSHWSGAMANYVHMGVFVAFLVTLLSLPGSSVCGNPLSWCLYFFSSAL